MIKLRRWLVRVLKKMIRWVDIPPSSKLVKFVAERVLLAEKMGASGEYKRHQVYAIATKKFPNVPKHIVSYVIERTILALR